MTGKSKFTGWLKNSKVQWGLMGGIWLVLLMAVVVPTWQGVVARNVEITDLEDRLATMDEWTVAGLWLAQSVTERQLRVDTVFDRLFPDDRARGELFLDLARVADQSGVMGFDLSEANTHGMSGNDVWGDGTSMGTTDDTGMGDAPAAGGNNEPVMQMDLPQVNISSYRVNARFYGDYQRIANFMGGLKNIERAMKVHSLVIRPDKDGIQVDLELDIYVNQQIKS